MACKEETPVLQKGSDLLFDYCCSVCEDDDTLTEAQFYCEGCSRWYCDRCVSLHGQMFKKHTTIGKGDIAKWPVARGVAELLSQCEKHNGKKIKMFCAEHSQLCCTTCVLLDHSVKKVTQITREENKKEHEDLQKLTADVTDLTQRLLKLIEQRELNIKSLQCDFDKILGEIALMRQKFNAVLDSLEKRTVNEGRALVSRLQESLQADVDVGKTALKRMQSFQEAVDKIGPNDSELCTIALIKVEKELSISNSFLRSTVVKSASTLSFTPNKEIETYFATVTSFGSTLSNMSYNVKLSDESSCEIRCICEMSDGNIILADTKNKNLKILDKEFRVISHCDTPSTPWYVCQVSDAEVAVVACDSKIYLLSVTDNKLVMKETINLTHPSFGIYHHNGQLYVSSGTALYRYTLTGTLIDKLYEDTSGTHTVFMCAINAGGDRIYVVNLSHHKVLTLSMSGQLLASFTDPELQSPIDIHVSKSEQVLVCGNTSKNIIQLKKRWNDWKIASVASLKEGNNVLSVCMLKRTGAVLIGRLEPNDIVAFETK